MFEHPVECGVRNERKERKFLLKHDLRVKKVILRVLNCMTLVSVCFRLSKQCERHFHINVVDGKSFLRLELHSAVVQWRRKGMVRESKVLHKNPETSYVEEGFSGI